MSTPWDSVEREVRASRLRQMATDLRRKATGLQDWAVELDVMAERLWPSAETQPVVKYLANPPEAT